MMTKLSRVITMLLFLVTTLAFAHFPNQSYIFISVYEDGTIEGRFEINVREVNKLLNTNLKDNISPQQIAPHIDNIKEYILNHTSFNSEFGEHRIELGDSGLFPVAQGTMVQFYFRLADMKELPNKLDVFYNCIFDKDDTHRGYLVTEYSWGEGVINEETNISLSFTKDITSGTLDFTNISVWNGVIAMIKQGIWHIWIGLDHILFLLALILPAVVLRKRDSEKTKIFDQYTAVEKFKPAFFFILRIVTFFTIAHTITLSLASLKIVTLPSSLVESIIAFSIGLAAFHNIIPILKGKDWLIAFVFGLFHGFGFASVLADLGLHNSSLVYSLLGFNIGVEIGQLVILMMIFPLLFLIRKRKVYPRIIVFGSVLLIVISAYWMIERLFGLEFGIEQSIKTFVYQLFVALGLK